MINFLKYYIKLAIVPCLYFMGIGTSIATIFKNAKYGFFLLIFLIPQPNIWYKFHQYPYGKDFLDILYLSVMLGLIFKNNMSLKNRNSILILSFIGISYISLWNTSLRFSLPLPVSTENKLIFPWKNYAQMIFLYILTTNIAKKDKDQELILLIIAFAVIIIGVRSARNFNEGTSFSYDRRAGGPFEVVGLGANHFGAFLSYCCTMFLGLYFYVKERKKKYFFLLASLVGLPGLLFSYSRGAYLAVFTGISFFAVIKKRSIVILLVIFLVFWKSLLPTTVVERIAMTETNNGQIEASAEHRFVLWEDALTLFYESPIFGIGFGGFGFTVAEDELKDTHNFFLKATCEQGIIGFLITISIFIAAFISGLKLFQKGKSRFKKGLGFGFMGCVIANIIANCFGDRFSYFEIGSYFWIIWAIVDNAINNQEECDQKAC